MNYFHIYLDKDENLWHRTAASSSSSTLMTNNSGPWRDIPVNVAVQQSFAAVSHLTEVIAQKHNQQQQGGSLSATTNSNSNNGHQFDTTREFNSYSVGARSSHFQQNQENEAADLSFIRPLQTRFLSLKDIDLPTSFSPSPTENDENDFFSAISLPHLFSHFANFVASKSQVSRRDSSIGHQQNMNNTNNEPVMMRFVALLGRNAGIMKLASDNENGNSKAAYNKLIDEAASKIVKSVLVSSTASSSDERNESSATTSPKTIQVSSLLSVDILLLPKAQTFASLISGGSGGDDQMNNINNNTSDGTKSPSSFPLSSSSVAVDEDFEACRQFSKKVLEKIHSLSHGRVVVKINVDRARDCSDIGGCISRAFLDHGK